MRRQGTNHQKTIAYQEEDMAKLLYIQASPRGERSFSTAVADAFVSTYRQTHGADEVLVRNLFDGRLPEFDGLALQAKYAILHQKEHSEAERAAWQAVTEVTDEFKSADKYLFAVPMWNFHLPYRLKHYIDILVQPTLTFSFDPQTGYQGLVTGKPAVVVYARGGEYAAGTPAAAMDFQSKYLESVLTFIGFTDIRRLVVEPTLSEPESVARTKQQAMEQAARLAAEF